MTNLPNVTFEPADSSLEGTVVVLAEEKFVLPNRAAQLNRQSRGQIKRAAGIADFKGESGRCLDLLAPNAAKIDRLLIVGVGEARRLDHDGWVLLGGRAYAELAARKIDVASIVLELKNRRVDSKSVAAFGLGMLLRSYRYTKFKKPNDRRPNKNAVRPASIRIVCRTHRAADKAFAADHGLADGVILARDLVNEPANTLGPAEFAERACELEKLGVVCESLDEAALEDIGMGALLAVGQGSARPSRVVVMRWTGTGRKRVRPLAFIGKGVVFDTGGISLKPAKGMEDMKGDMGGAAAVVGLMHALAVRRVPINAVGVIGLVENMPSANAQRPGDIVTSLSGQTVEVLNTDAEGRLVLADLLWYTQDRFKPKMMINLATLTGAIMVALGQEYAGLFSNDDKLADRLAKAGHDTGEKVWRMPLDPAYDKEIDSKIADIRNIGARWGGAITAAQFLQRFVRDVPWAHLDVAGTAFASKRSDINESWASGFGVRLLDRLVAEHYQD